MSKFKNYKLEVIYPGRTGVGSFEKTVNADYFTWNDAGMYLFYNGSEGSTRRLIACYPIINTIIKEIKDQEPLIRN